MAYLPLDTVKLFVDLFDVIYLRYYKIEKINYDKEGLSKIYILDDELVLLVSIQKDDRTMPLNAKEIFKKTHGRGNRYVHVPQPKDDYFVLTIEELTPNTIGFDLVYREFIYRLETLTGLRPLQFDVDYLRFNGWDRVYWDEDRETALERVNRKMPELKLRQRYEKWQGNKFNFVIIDINTRGDKHVYGVAYTKTKPENYIKKWAERYMKRGNMANTIRNHVELEKTLKTLRAKTRYKRLNRVSYGTTSGYSKEKDDAWKYADKLLIQAQKDEHKQFEKMSINIEKPEKSIFWPYK